MTGNVSSDEWSSQNVLRHIMRDGFWKGAFLPPGTAKLISTQSGAGFVGHIGCATSWYLQRVISGADS